MMSFECVVCGCGLLSGVCGVCRKKDGFVSWES